MRCKYNRESRGVIKHAHPCFLKVLPQDPPGEGGLGQDIGGKGYYDNMSVLICLPGVDGSRELDIIGKGCAVILGMIIAANLHAELCSITKQPQQVTLFT